MKRFQITKIALLTFLTIAYLLVSSVSAQTLVWEVFWGTSGFEVAHGVVSETCAMSLDGVGNVYITGVVQPGPSGGYDAFLSAFDRFGVLRWQTFWGTRARYDDAGAVTLDVNGNIYITGTTSPGPFGAYDVFLASFNSSGGFRWEAFWGTSCYDWGKAIAVDDFGNIYVTGRTGEVYSGPYDAFLVSFNSSGGFRWEAFWGTQKGYEGGAAVVVDDLGNSYVGGRTGQGEIHGQPYDAFLISYNQSGNFRWEAIWGKVACDFVYGIVLDSFGNVYIAGVTYIFGPFGGDDAFLVSFNSSGGFRWEAFWGSPGREVALEVALDLFGNAYIAGYVSGGPFGGEDAFIASFDSSGSFKWEVFWGTEGFDRAAGVSLDLCGNVYIAGHTHPGPSGGYDAFLAAFALPPVSAEVDIDPNTLNLASNGKWITCYIELPEDYDVNEIDINTLRLSNNTPVDLSAPSEIGDHDMDGIPDLMVKFDRLSVLGQLCATDYTTDTGKSYEDAMNVWGIMRGMPFEGFGTVRILNKG